MIDLYNENESGLSAQNASETAYSNEKNVLNIFVRWAKVKPGVI